LYASGSRVAVAALVTSAWLTPWCLVWVLPLAAIGAGLAPRLVTLIFCGY
jgi:hypothetical protein